MATSPDDIDDMEECVTHGDWVFLALAAVAAVGALFGLNLGCQRWRDDERRRKSIGFTCEGFP